MVRSGMRLAVIGAVVCGALSLGGLLAMTGQLRAMLSPSLSAEVHLSEYPLPTGFGLDPQVVSDFLSNELIKRAGEDIALRLALGDKSQERLTTIVIPRLISPTVVRDMVKEIQPLANVLSVGNFRMAARVVISNRGPARQGVALTLPGAVLAEAAGDTLKIETTSTGLTAVPAGDMAAGETRVLTVWLGQAALDAGKGLGKQVLLGAAGGETGQVWIYGSGSWPGADLEAMPAARWMVGGALLLVLAVAAMVLVMAALSVLVGRRRQNWVNRA